MLTVWTSTKSGLCIWNAFFTHWKDLTFLVSHDVPGEILKMVWRISLVRHKRIAEMKNIEHGAAFHPYPCMDCLFIKIRGKKNREMDDQLSGGFTFHSVVRRRIAIVFSVLQLFFGINHLTLFIVFHTCCFTQHEKPLTAANCKLKVGRRLIDSDSNNIFPHLLPAVRSYVL